MFGGNKPAFGTTSTTSGFGFNNTATAGPFGAQSTFGKPATTGFGQPAFGQSNTSMFVGQQPATGLFGATTSSTFGSPATTQQQTGFGSFAQPQQQTTSLFGSQPQGTANTSLFGQPSTSAFGAPAKPPGFGFAATQPQSLFGQAGTSNTTTGFGAFGQPAISNAGTAGVFGSTAAPAFGQSMTGTQSGTMMPKYQPIMGQDTLVKNGVSTNINTKQHCITSMKEYEAKSLEELRTEDYLASRKGPQAGGSVQPTGGLFGATQPAAGGLFGSTATQQTTGLFGQQQPTATNTLGGGFGATAQPTMSFGAPQQSTMAFGSTPNQQSTGLFGKPFGAPTTSAPAFGSFGTTTTNNNLFGAKPFGQQGTTGMFGQAQQPTASAFGQPTTGFGTFGQTNTNQAIAPLFGAATTTANAFGLTSSTPNTGFGFGTTNTSTAGTGLFGPKPAGGFGTTPGFGTVTSTAPTGFGGFGQPNQTSGSLFNNTFNKPAATPAFGAFGMQQPTSLGGGIGIGTQQNTMFGNTAAKPLMFGTTGTSGGGLFGQNPSPFGQANTLGGGFGQNMGMQSGSLFNTNANQQQQQQQQQSVSIHQQIMALASSQYGDLPIFKDLKPLSGPSEEALRTTNPVAQKAFLDQTANQYKVSTKWVNGIKVKPVGSDFSKKSLFGGLEKYDASVEESFNLKPNAKRLIIKPKGRTDSLTNNSLNNDTNTSKPNSPANVRTTQSPIEYSPSVERSNSATAIKGRPSLDSARESFRNTIPTTVPSPNELENTRRVSWLHSNALEKVTQKNRLSDHVLDNTIDELVTVKTMRPVSGDDENEGNADGNTNSDHNDEGDELNVTRPTNLRRQTSTDSLLSTTRSFLDESNADLSLISSDPHPTGIIMHRSGYYTIPSLDELLEYLNDDGTCIVPNFTIGRRGYGNVYYNESMDVAGLNIDELVHFRHKQLIIYPDEENKPPIGMGLNRKAQITLDQVWPHDKTLHQPIKDRDRLEAIGFEDKLRRVCDKYDTRFIEYRPETGSWVFKVDHFSKYGLSDSDEEDGQVEAKKAKLAAAAAALAAQKVATAKNVRQDELARTGSSSKVVTIMKPSPLPFDRHSELTMQIQHGLGGHHSSNLVDDEYERDVDTLRIKRPGQPTSPSAALAMDMGSDSHKLQLMKASLFNDDDDDGKSEFSVISEQFDDRDSPDQMVPNTNKIFSNRLRTISSMQSKLSKNVVSTISSDSIMDTTDSFTQPEQFVADKMQQQTDNRYEMGDNKQIIKRLEGPKSGPLIIKPKIAPIKCIGVVVPISKSRNTISKCSNQLAPFHGRRFKIGWGAANQLATLNTLNNSEHLKGTYNSDEFAMLLNGRLSDDYSKSIVQCLQISSTQQIDNFSETIEAHLMVQLEQSRFETAESDCPKITAGGGTGILEKHYHVAERLSRLGSELESYAVTVWGLCMALWADHEELEEQDPLGHLTIIRRRELFSEWLEGVVIEPDVIKKSMTNLDYLDHLYELLMGHKIRDACELAFKNNDFNLSLLLAQISGGPTIRQFIQHQLAGWQDVKADEFVDLLRLKIFMLIAGIPLMSSWHGAINIFEGIDWLRALALNLWYICSPTASITDALIMYEDAHRADEFYAQPPIPPYSSEYIPQGDKPIEDLRFHILKLYSRRSHPLECLLNPATHTSDPMDIRLSWLILQVLETLGYHHCSERSEIQIHVAFANQLEANGLWHWSIFVLLHIKNDSQRELCIQDALYRYITLSKDVEYTKKEEFIIEQLSVPKKWIYWAKSVRAGADRNYPAQAHYLLKAKQWAMAHDIIMIHLAPDAIINDNIQYLKDLLNRFEDPRQVPNWANQGMILLDFMDFNEKFESLKTIHEDELETRWESLKPQLSELCSRINLFPCPTDKHRLCQSEIAQRLACLISTVRIMCPDINPCTLIRLALEKLPLPEEYAKQKIRELLEDHALADMLMQTQIT